MSDDIFDDDDDLPLAAPDREPAAADQSLPIAERLALGAERGTHIGGGIVSFPAHVNAGNLPEALTGDERRAHQGRLGKGYRATVHPYPDESGRLIMAALRYDHPTESKIVRGLRYCGKGKDGLDLYWFTWVPGTLPLQGLDDLAGRPDAPVVVAEGEKAAAAARALFPDHVVVCWPSGAAGVRRVDLSPLAGRRVILFPDNDPAGRGYMRIIAARAYQAGAASVAMVDVPSELGAGWDVADPIPAGAGAVDLRRLLDTARPITPAAAAAMLPDPRRRAAAKRLLGYAPGYSRVDPDAIADALALLDPDMPGRMWYTVGRCLFSALAAAGEQMYVAWSAEGAKHKPGEPAAVWAKFAEEERFTAPPLAWLLRKARKAGEENQRNGKVDSAAHLRACIEEVSEDHAVVVRGSKTVVAWELWDPRFERYAMTYLKKSDFVDKLVRQVPLPGEDGKDSKASAPIGKLWHGTAARRQYDTIRFMPAGRPNRGELNSWTGFAVEPADDPEGWSRLKQHLLDNVAGGNAKAYAYILDWMAAGVQWLHRPVGSALVLVGAKGAGKSILIELYGYLFGAHRFVTSQSEDIVGKFNAHLETTLLLGVEEAFAPQNRAADGVLKDLVTRTTLRVEDKFFSTWTAPNYLRIIMTSNNDQVVRADGNDRRYAVFEVTNPHQADPDARRRYFGEMVEQMETGGYQAMLGELMARDIGGFNQEAIPETEALRRQKLLNLGNDPVRSWLHARLADGVHITLDQGDSEPGHRWAETSDTEVPVRAVLDDFRRYCRDNGLRASERKLSLQLPDYMPEGFASEVVRFATVDGTSTQRVYRFPAIGDARAAFARRAGMETREADAG